jgi:diguanylate cyclase (GGDEF)-like protein
MSSSIRWRRGVIHHVAHHDALTGLPNRLHLMIALERALAVAHRQRTKIALLFLDLDRFKLVNDTLGHHIGDLLLIAVAQRLRQCVRESDILARLGGDEFVVGLTGMAEDDSGSEITAIASKLLHTFRQPYAINEHILHSSPSLGISIYPGDGTDIATLMKNADAAMYQAKEQRRNNVQYFTAR